MKMKSLLFAALVAGISMNASAKNETFDNCGDVMSADNVTLKAGEMVEGGVALTLDKKHEKAVDFTNIQFDITFPQDANGKALRPCLDEDGVYDWSGDDIDMVGKPKAPCVAYSNNFGNPEKYPNMLGVVGVNMTKTAVTANPVQLYCMNVTADEDMLGGEYQIIVKDLMYTTYSDDAYETAEPQVLCTVTVDAPTAVRDLNVNGVKTRKVVENGQVYIIAGDAKYTVMGQKVK